MKVLRILTVSLVALVVATGAGCGGGDDNGGGDEQATQTETGQDATQPAGGAETTSVSMDEYSFSPDDPSVKSGDTLTVENKGQIGHNLTIEQGSKKVAGTSTFLSGKSEKLKVDLEPGKYAMVCTVSGHKDLGMSGTITVK